MLGDLRPDLEYLLKACIEIESKNFRLDLQKNGL